MPTLEYPCRTVRCRYIASLRVVEHVVANSALEEQVHIYSFPITSQSNAVCPVGCTLPIFVLSSSVIIPSPFLSTKRTSPGRADGCNRAPRYSRGHPLLLDSGTDRLSRTRKSREIPLRSFLSRSFPRRWLPCSRISVPCFVPQVHQFIFQVRRVGRNMVIKFTHIMFPA